MLDYRRPDWMDDAACIGAPVNFIDAEDKQVTTAQSLQTCGRCAAMLACRDYALADKSLVGIWGGTTTAARRAIRRAREVGE